MSSNKIKSHFLLKKMVDKLRRKHKRVVFTNGCFDILHHGHVYYLEKARRLGDCLVVAVNSDRSVRKLKGRGRPINSERDRASVLAGLASVDMVTVFDDDTPLRLIRKVKPDVLVKGGDWSAQNIVGARDVKEWGGVVRRIKLLKGRSTTRIIHRSSHA